VHNIVHIIFFCGKSTLTLRMLCHFDHLYYLDVIWNKVVTNCPHPFLGVEQNRVHYYWGHHWPIVPALDDDRWGWVWSNRWNAWQRKPKYLEKNCLSATLFTANPTWPGLGLNPGCRSGKLATNCLRCLLILRPQVFHRSLHIIANSI
jgi:hypothetical protein